MCKILKVTGNSLEPAYLEGDFVLTLKIPFYVSAYKSGDTVVFQHPDYGVMIKQVESLSSGGKEIFVAGTHPLSTDSRHFGPVHKRDILGKVIWHIKRPRQFGRQ